MKQTQEVLRQLDEKINELQSLTAELRISSDRLRQMLKEMGVDGDG